MPANHNLALTRRMVREVWNLRDPDAADHFFSSDYVNHGGLIIDLVKGPESIKMTVELFRAAFPKFWVTIDNQHTDGDRNIIQWTANREKPARKSNIAMDRRSSSFSGQFMFLVTGGMITESWTYWDKKNVISSRE